MAFENYTFSGKAAYLSKQYKIFDNKPDEKVWSFRFYTDAEGRKAIKATGMKNKVHEDDGEKSGVEGLFHILRAKEEFPIVSPAGDDITDLVGNGSEVTVDVTVETFTSKIHGPQARSQVNRVTVTKLIPYVKAEAEVSGAEPKEELPA
jgi:hypothetical protein